MKDRFKRKIDYLRISVTDKCNLRCVYCMPEGGVPRRRHEDFLSFEAMTEIVRVAVGLGIVKVRLTGGEPLVKRGIVTFVEMLKSVTRVNHLAMTTNGTRLEGLAQDLKRAGLDSVNISLDTLDPERYHRITRVGDIKEVLRGIDAAQNAGLPIKINMVVLEDTGPDEVERMRRFCRDKGLSMQLINHYSLTETKKNSYRFDRPPDCALCNRIRLMADGYLKPCLHSDIEIKVDLGDIRGSLLSAVESKPEKGSVCLSRRMVEIGG
jgi:cyclic pyranopterin phosphate synthase